MTTNPPRIRKQERQREQVRVSVYSVDVRRFTIQFFRSSSLRSSRVSPVYLSYMFGVSLIFVDDSYLLLLLPSHAKAFHIFKIEMNSSVTFSLCDSFLSSFVVCVRECALGSLSQEKSTYYFTLSALSR